MSNILKHPEAQLYLVLGSILIIIAFFINIDFGFLLTTTGIGFLCGLWVSNP